jgi:hypothetical protein
MKASRADALDVPEMEVLVAAEAEELAVVPRPFGGRRGSLPWNPRRQVVAAAQQAGREAVLQPAVAVPDHLVRNR